MKFISLHCDYIRFKPLKKALKQPEEISEKKKGLTEIKEPLVILTAIEKQDETNTDIVKQYIDEIIKIAEQVNSKNIVLYPYAHLSPSLSRPDFALKILEQAEKELSKNKSFSVSRAPFGYYKEFELKCKGHPLSELSREITNKEAINVIEETYDPKKLLNEISKTKLDLRKLKENDHRILGQQMDLFSFNETAPGMVFWHDKGLIIYNQLVDLWRQEHKKAGYKEIKTPQILDKRLWQISGHWEKYRENVFISEYDNKPFIIKPMNCPGGLLVFKSKPKSYKDLPLRVGELGIVHRQELSGVLSGLFRVIQFTQDDAHIYCKEDQIVDELILVIELIEKFYRLFGFEYHVELSTRPEKRIGDDSVWDKAEAILEKALKKKKIKFKINLADGAFYGPKIDFHIKDSLGRTWQCGTLQLDFSFPERFDICYTDSDNNQKRPIMLHRTIYGSLERFIGILLEHYNGHLPLWLSPVQIRVINFTDRNNKSCEKLYQQLLDLNVRVDFDFSQEPIQGKIKQAVVEKIPYIVVIGDKEESQGTLAVRKKGKIIPMKDEEFLKQIQKEIENKE